MRHPKDSDATTELIPFQTFLKSPVFAHASATRTFLLQNQVDQDEFLDSITPPGRSFPQFSYNDSVLVGVITAHVRSSSTFQIDSLKRFGNVIRVFCTTVESSSQALDQLGLCHIVVIKKPSTEFTLVLMHTIRYTKPG
jgi:hypothetical protein